MRKEQPGITVETKGDNKALMVWGWVAVILAVAVGVATVQLSAALSAGIFILSAFGGLSMTILSVGKAIHFVKCGDAELLQAKAIQMEAQSRRALANARLRLLGDGDDRN